MRILNAVPKVVTGIVIADQVQFPVWLTERMGAAYSELTAECDIFKSQVEQQTLTRTLATETTSNSGFLKKTWIMSQVFSAPFRSISCTKISLDYQRLDACPKKKNICSYFLTLLLWCFSDLMNTNLIFTVAVPVKKTVSLAQLHSPPGCCFFMSVIGQWTCLSDEMSYMIWIRKKVNESDWSGIKQDVFWALKQKHLADRH